jgi:hypothetical protein
VTPSDVAVALFDEDAALPATVVAAASRPSWHRPGLLSFWVDDEGRADLEEVLGVPMDGRLLSWTAATAAGERADAVRDTLWGAVALRLLGHHFSALRAWIARHVHVVGRPMGPDLARETDGLVQPSVPPLLRASGPPTPARDREAEIRAAVNAERRVRGGARQQLMAEIRARRDHERT